MSGHAAVSGAGIRMSEWGFVFLFLTEIERSHGTGVIAGLPWLIIIDFN
jgi:hypothetical protein